MVHHLEFSLGDDRRWPTQKPASPEQAKIWRAMAWNNRNGALAFLEKGTVGLPLGKHRKKP